MHYNIDNNNTKIVENWKEKITMAKTTKLSDRMKRYEAVTNNELT